MYIIIHKSLYIHINKSFYIYIKRFIYIFIRGPKVKRQIGTFLLCHFFFLIVISSFN